MLEVSALSFDYQDKPLLSEVNFSLMPGQMLHLQGKNGTGKTTLLRLLAGILHPLVGQISYLGQSIHQNLKSYQQQLCYLGHRPGINPLLTVRENCLLDWHWGRKVVDLQALLQAFGLNCLANEPASYLSLGQKRRLSVLRLIFGDAKLWLLDEPFIGLDAKAIELFMQYLDAHLLEGNQVILTSHQPLSLEAHVVYSLEAHHA